MLLISIDGKVSPEMAMQYVISMSTRLASFVVGTGDMAHSRPAPMSRLKW